MVHKRMNMAFTKRERSSGFSLVELMLAMLIGLIILGGVMQVYISTQDTQRSSDDQLEMLGNARFALETIAYDLRHTNIWGRHNNGQLILCHKYEANFSAPCPAGFEMPAATDDCAVEEYINFKRPLKAFDGNNPYSATCAKDSYKVGTDVLTLRYADTTRIDDAVLAQDVAYVRTDFGAGLLFVGQGPNWLPDPPTKMKGWDQGQGASNHLLVSRAYYVSDYTDEVGDGVPSLRRSDLVAGPAMQSDVLLTGVEDLQLEFGVDVGTNGVQGSRDGIVDSYVKASSVGNWSLDVVAVRIWILMRAERADRNDIGSAQTFNIAGEVVTTPNDGHRRYLVSGVVKLRNTTQKNVLTAGGA